jgi:hypothetical protein
VRYAIVAFFYAFHVMVMATITISFAPHQAAMSSFLPLERVRPVLWTRNWWRRRRGRPPLPADPLAATTEPSVEGAAEPPAAATDPSTTGVTAPLDVGAGVTSASSGWRYAPDGDGLATPGSAQAGPGEVAGSGSGSGSAQVAGGGLAGSGVPGQGQTAVAGGAGVAGTEA